jgi:hypothetical protein
LFLGNKLFLNMKLSFNSPLCIALMALLATVACTSTETSAPKPSTAAPDAKMAVMASPTDSITKDSALAQQNRWQTTRNAVITSLGGPNGANSKYIVKGFQVPVQDLKGILNAYYDGANSSADSIYAMLSISYNGNNSTSETSLILQVKDRRTGRMVNYDFSKPCPPLCNKD